MKGSHDHRIRIILGLAALCVAGGALFVQCSAAVRRGRVIFSNGSWLAVRKVTYGKRNVYYHNPVRRAAAALISDSTWDAIFSRWATSMGVSSVNSCADAPYEQVVVFGDFCFVPAGGRFWEFTVCDANGNENGPLETILENMSNNGPSTVGPCILAYGTNVPNKGPCSVRIYERESNRTRKLVGNVPVQVHK